MKKKKCNENLKKETFGVKRRPKGDQNSKKVS